MSAVEGFATPEATKAYADKCWKNNPNLSPDGWRLFDGLTIGKVGFGTYRISGLEDEVASLEKALTGGINLIDMAPNYTDGYGEQTVGEVLAELFKSGALKREEVVLVGKAGYLQGADMDTLSQNPPPETAILGDDLWYCIHPHFLDRQITQTCARLEVKQLDALLLHNPEYLFHAPWMENLSAKEVQEKFYEHIEQAFEYLEQACKDGRIGRYGISSNTLTEDRDADGFIDLARLAEVADAAAQKVHGRKKRSQFRVVQLPLNLLELGALKNHNTKAKTFEGDEDVPVLELATRRRMAVMANRPLNAFSVDGQAFRLADDEHTKANLAVPIAKMVSVEEELERLLGGWPQIGDEAVLAIGEEGEELAKQVEHSLHADQVISTFFEPHAVQFVQVLGSLTAEGYTDEATASRLHDAYVEAFLEFCAAVRAQAKKQDVTRIKPIRDVIEKNLPKRWEDAPMAEISLGAVASVPGVTCVLCGLRTPAYTTNAFHVMERGDFPDASKILAPAIDV